MDKTDILSRIISDPILGRHALVMVGDRESDFLAAANVKIPSLAVRWGYGNDKEFAHATAIADCPCDLLDMIKKNGTKSAGRTS